MSDDAHDAEAEPERFGPYLLLEQLGAGGQGVVHLAEDTRLRRRVALKLLGRGPVGDDTLARFRREAEAASRLDHPAICSIHEAGEIDGQPYLAMQFVPGETLAQRIARQWVGDDKGDSGDDSDPSTRDGIFRICRMFETVASALHRAHEQGLIHRDIKPGNLMVTPDGDPVILDFGLARDEQDDDVSLTQTGDLLGTPAYMSPEQLMAQRIPLDRRTDVYSLGATLYECLTMHRPFESTTRAALYQSILTDPPSRPSSHNKLIPRDLEVVVETALEKNRDRRYQTAEAFAEDLRRVRSFEPVRARPIGPWLRTKRWAQRHPAVASGAVLLIVAFAVTLTLLGETRSALRRSEALRMVEVSASMGRDLPGEALDKALEAVALDASFETIGQVRNALALPLPEQRFDHPLYAPQLQRSPDGQRLFVMTGRAPDQEALLLSGDGEMLRRTPIGPLFHGGNWGFSPSGRFVYVHPPEGALQVWSSEDGAAVTLGSASDRSNTTHSTWLPDDRLVVVTAAGGLDVVDCDDGSRTSVRTARASAIVTAPVVHEGGRSVTVGTDAPALETWSLSSAEEHAETPLAARPDSLHHGPVLGTVVAILDDGTLAFCSEDVERTAGPDSDPGWSAATRVEAAPDGTRFVSTHAAGSAQLWDASGTLIARLERPGSALRAQLPRLPFRTFSADGRRLTTHYEDRIACLWDRDGQLLRTITGHSGSSAYVLDWFGDRVLYGSAGYLDVLDADGRVVHELRVSDNVTGAVLVDQHTLWMTSVFSLSRWDLRTLPFRAHDAAIRQLIVRGNEIVTAGNDGRVRRWTGGGTMLHEYGPVPHAVTAAAVSDDGRWVASGGHGGQCTLWPTEGGDPARRWQLEKRGDVDGTVKGLMFLGSDPPRLFVSGWLRDAWLLDTSGSDAQSFPLGADGAGDAVIHDGSVIHGIARFDGSRDAGARVWHPTKGLIQELRLPDQDTGEAVGLTDDGLWLAVAGSSSGPAPIHVFHRPSTEARFDGPKLVLDDHGSYVWSLDFSSDGRMLLSSSSDGTARIWSMPEGRPLAVMRGHDGTVREARFLPDDRHVVTAGQDGYVRRWLVDEDEVLEQAKERAAALR